MKSNIGLTIISLVIVDWQPLRIRISERASE